MKILLDKRALDVQSCHRCEKDSCSELIEEIGDDLREVIKHGHGAVVVKVHGGRITDIEKTLKKRK